MIFFKNSRTSLSFKLTAPIIVVGLITLIVIERLDHRIASRIIDTRIAEETQYIADVLVLFAEVGQSRAHIRRFANASAANDSIVSLRLIKDSTGEVIVDNKNQNIGKLFTAVASKDQLELFKLYKKGVKSESENRQKFYVYKFIPVNLIDYEEKRLRPYTIFIAFDTKKLHEDAFSLELSIVLPIALGIAFLVFVVYWIQKKVLIDPLKDINETLKRQKLSNEVLYLSVKNRDELGVVAKSYNELASEKSFKEHELESVRKYIDGITDQVPVLLAYIDSDYIVRFANHVHERWYDKKLSDIIGKYAIEVYGNDVFDKLYINANEVFRGTVAQFDLSAKYGGDTDMYTFVTWTPDFDQEGKVIGSFICIEDRTQLKDAEEKLIEYANDLEFKTWALEDARDDAEKSAKAKSEFLATMSHEIRTPINGVIGMLNLLLKEQLNEKQLHYSRLAHSSAESLLSLINDILDFSKIEAGKLDIESIPFNLYEVVENLSDSFVYGIEEKGVELILDINADVPFDVIGDPSRIRQVLANFMSNAVKFTDSGSVTLQLKLLNREDDNAMVEIAVVDTGIGIPHEKQAALFQSFSQVDASTTRKYGGTGLGLAIVKQLVALMKGRVGFESEPGWGSRFWFSLPFKDVSETRTFKQNDAHVQLICVSDQEGYKSIEKHASLWACQVDFVDSVDDCYQKIAHIDSRIYRCIVLLNDLDQQSEIQRRVSQIRAPEIVEKVQVVPILSVSQISNNENSAAKLEGLVLSRPIKPFALFRMIQMIVEGEVAHISSQGSRPNRQDKLHVLLVEDNPINQEVACGILESLSVNVDVASNGLRALAKLCEKGPAYYQIIFMDCQMPGIDGYETTGLIRRGNIGVDYTRVPIIAMTANAMKGDKEKCLDAGMSDYISKPIEVSLLENKLASWWQPNDSAIVNAPKKLFGNDQCEENEQNNEAGKAGENFDPSVWDRDAFYKRLKGKKERIDRLVNMFLDGMPERMDRLKDAVEEADAKHVYSIAHEIKGVSGNISAGSLHELAAQLEAMGKGGDLSGAGPVFHDANIAFEVLQQALRADLALSG